VCLDTVGNLDLEKIDSIWGYLIIMVTKRARMSLNPQNRVDFYFESIFYHQSRDRVETESSRSVDFCYVKIQFLIFFKVFIFSTPRTTLKFRSTVWCNSEAHIPTFEYFEVISISRMILSRFNRSTKQTKRRFYPKNSALLFQARGALKSL